jgi:methionine-rich copper-binding protein CopC
MQSKVIPGKPSEVQINISTNVNLKQSQTKIVSSSGKVISKAIIKISKDNKISVTLPKGTKPGTYTLQIKANNGKTYKAVIVVLKK